MTMIIATVTGTAIAMGIATTAATSLVPAVRLGSPQQRRRTG
jgi:HAMP domain-containing protein